MDPRLAGALLRHYVPPQYRRYARGAAAAAGVAGALYKGYSSRFGKTSARQGSSIFNATAPARGKPYGSGAMVAPFRPARAGGAVKRGRRPRRYKKKVPRAVARYVKNAVRHADNDDAVNTWRDISGFQWSCDINQCNYYSATLGLRSDIEDAIDGAKVPYNNAGVPDYATVDLTDISVIKNAQIHIHQMISRYHLRNNGHTPCYIECFWFKCRRPCDSGDNPYAMFDQQLTNKGIASNHYTDPRFNMWDAGSALKKFWRMYRYRKYNMNAGDELRLDLKARPFQYNVSDDQTFINSPKRTHYIIIRVIGVPSHDETSTGNVGTCPATLDVVRHRHIKFSAKLADRFKHIQLGSTTLDEMTTPQTDVPYIIKTDEDL